MEYKEIEKIVKETLSEKRFLHSKGVAKTAEELAKIYGEDDKKAKIIGIAHDIAKEMPKEDASNYAKEHNIIFDEVEQKESGLWHSKIGAYVAIEKFGFTKDMAQSIMYHTTGNTNMTTMDKIIFLADKTEDGRTVEAYIEAREVAKTNLDEAILIILKETIKYCLNKNSLIHPDTIELMNKIISQNRYKNNEK